jgi:hypothetical protein
MLVLFGKTCANIKRRVFVATIPGNGRLVGIYPLGWLLLLAWLVHPLNSFILFNAPNFAEF